MSHRPSNFFPPSAYSFHEAMDLLNASSAEQTRLYTDLLVQLNNLSKEQSQFYSFVQNHQAQARDADTEQLRLLNKTIECLDTVVERLSVLQTGHQEFRAKLDAIIGGLSGIYQKDFPIDVRFEREYYKDFPVGASPKAPDFQRDFLSLVDGLDKESIETVVLTLHRLEIIQNLKESNMAPFSEEEKQTIRYLVEHFHSNVLKLSETCYFYRGCLLPINQFESCVFWDKCGLPYLEHPEQLADKDIIDAGAFIGDSALILAPFTSHTVYAFEPMPTNFELLLKTINMNELTNVVACNLALGEQVGTIRLSPSINFNGSGSTQFKNDAFNYREEIEVPITTLDKFVKEKNLQVGLIKADVEGAEQFLLRGAMETVKTQKPALLISIYHNASDFFKIKPMLEDLDLGYKFKIRHPVGGSVMTEMILIAEV